MSDSTFNLHPSIEELRRIIAEKDKQLAAMETRIQELSSAKSDACVEAKPMLNPYSFQPETLRTYEALVAACKEMRTLHGSNYRLTLKLLGGDVFLYHIAHQDGREYYDIQWFGKPEPFGFCIMPDRSIRGPYHFH
jgi:hypothetical protein